MSGSTDQQGSGTPLDAIAGFGTITSGYMEGRSAVLQADFEANQKLFERELLEIQQGQMLEASDQEIDKLGKEVQQMLGSQKTSLAANGIDVNGDIALDAEFDVRKAAAEDVVQIKNNAWRQSLGMDIQKSDLKMQSKFTRLAGKSSKRKSISEGWGKGLGQLASGTISAVKMAGGGA